MRKLRYDVGFHLATMLVNMSRPLKMAVILSINHDDNKGFDHIEQQSAEYSLCAQQFFAAIRQSKRSWANRLISLCECFTNLYLMNRD